MSTVREPEAELLQSAKTSLARTYEHCMAKLESISDSDEVEEAKNKMTRLYKQHLEEIETMLKNT